MRTPDIRCVSCDTLGPHELRAFDLECRTCHFRYPVSNAMEEYILGEAESGHFETPDPIVFGPNYQWR